MIGLYVVFFGLSVFLIRAYRSAYPQPYAQIPYNNAASKRLWGDIPELIEAVKSTQDPAKFLFEQCRKLKSPVVQLFLRPFGKPIIFINDVREVKDILSTRTKEFDRAPRTRHAFRPIVPHCSLVKATTPEWKAQRRFWEGVMGAAFLRRVAAPKMHRVALELVELLKAKASIADGRPFYFFDDIDLAAFDVIWKVVFGTDLEAVRGEREQIVSGAKRITQPTSKDSPAVLTVGAKPEMYQYIALLIQTVEKTFASFSQPLHHWVLRQGSAYRQKVAVKNKIVDEVMSEARSQLSELSDEQLLAQEETSALVLGLRRELLARRSESGTVTQNYEAVRDELLMLLIGGHETKAVVLSWAITFLTHFPEKQTRLRDALLAIHPERSEGSQPLAENILSKSTPYMDAWIEETLRMGNVSSRLVRVATTDTTVLGQFIPKGAQVVCNPYVGGDKPLYIPEELRSDTSQQSKANFRSHWDPNCMDEFIPERWLHDDGSFDPRMFPRLAFSAGPRVCYGRSLALQEFRIMLTMLVLNFKFEALPEEFSGLEAHQRILRVPRHCYVRLTAL